MDIKITENLKKIRRDNGNTQEDLATHLNISIQAVSKWERGEGFPDITLLPSIASYYGKTVDELLGCDQIECNKKIDEYMNQYSKNGNVGKIEDNIFLMREALKEFPQNLNLMSNLCHALLFIDKDEYLDECIEIGEKILENSVDDQQRYSTIQTLVYAYDRKKNEIKAQEYAKKLPNLFCTQNTVLEGILKGDELLKLVQGNIGQHIGLIDSSVDCMLRSKKYTPEERIFAYETVDKLYRLFLYDENYGCEHYALHMLWMNIAREYGKLCNQEKTISALKKAYYHSYKMDNFHSGEYTSIFADTGKYSKESFSRNFESSYIDWLKKVMQEKVFDFIRNTDEWKNIIPQ
ncbi:MAG: helix-turn-helix transcriptional regulator [Eubacteriales bacterium]|nr:helix-turn-helix transcriptional regulator [Eubacteriales bacterium]